MPNDQVTVVISETDSDVTAHIIGPLAPRRYEPREPAERLRRIIDPLERSGLECVVAVGPSSLLVHVLLPDGSFLTISPPQRHRSHCVAGQPHGWVVARDHPDKPDMHEVVYDEGPDDARAANGGGVPALVAAVFAYLIQAELPGLQQAVTKVARAEEILLRAGFTKSPSADGAVYGLPVDVANRDRRSAAVTAVSDALRAEGYRCASPASLLNPVPPDASPGDFGAGGPDLPAPEPTASATGRAARPPR